MDQDACSPTGIRETASGPWLAEGLEDDGNEIGSILFRGGDGTAPAHIDRAGITARLEQQAEALLELARAIRSAPSITLADDNLAPDRHALDRHVYAEVDWQIAADDAYRDRRRRDRIFGDLGLFGEPAWDILLDLTLTELKGRKLSVTSACIGACVPSTTALRWLTVLEHKGLVVRENDARDGRRAFVRISPDGFRKMVAWLSRGRSI